MGLSEDPGGRKKVGVFGNEGEMTERKVLPLRTAAGGPLVHAYWAQEEPRGLAVFLPGNHYGMDGPLLYYPALTLRQRGWDTLALTYGYQSAGREFSVAEIGELIEEVGGVWRQVAGQREYARLAVVGKSLGALLAAELCHEGVVPARAAAVYLTPPLANAFFRQLFLATPQRALVAAGTEDRFYDPQALAELEADKEFHLCLVEGADHGMNVAADLGASLDALRRVTRAVVEFLDAEVG